MVPNTIRKQAPTGNVPIGGSPLQAVTNLFPQAGRNPVTEAPEVIFNLTHGDEGMETPPPNDSLKGPLSPPVGGCLCSLRRHWQNKTKKCSNNMLLLLPMVTFYHLSQNQN